MTQFFGLSDLGLSSSSSSLIALWLQSMQAQYNGYAPSASALEFVQAQVFSTMAADLAQLCSQGATELFRTFGTTLIGVPYENGVAAQAIVNVTATAAGGQIATLSSALSTGGPITSLPVIQLANGIASGTITITSGVNTQNWTTSGASAGDTSISVTSQTPNFAYPIGSAITGTAAYSIPALTQFILDSLGFQTLAPVTINAGTSSNVTLTAVLAGAAFNGAGSGGNVQFVLQQSWVQSVAVVTSASNGADPESDQHYLDRLTTALQLMAPRPITASDFAAMALNFNPYPGTDQQIVGRATAVDGYDPNSATYNNEREVTVAITDANGFALNNDTMYGYPNGTAANPITTFPTANAGWGIEGWLRSLREVNFLVNVVSPTYSGIYLVVTVKAASGYDSTTVQNNVQAALLSYFSPNAWGLPASSAIGWSNNLTIYRSNVESVIVNAGGVDHVVTGTLAFGLTANPGNFTTDLTLPGPVPLPTSSVTSIPTSAITVT